MDSGYGRLIGEMIAGVMVAMFVAGVIVASVLGVAGYFFAKWMGWL